jgi:hypothetical protein
MKGITAIILSLVIGVVPLFSQNSMLRDFSCQDAGSSGTTYACSLPVAPGSYATGQVYRVMVNTTNTGASTINLNSLGAKTLKKASGNITTDLAAGDIQAGQWITLIYDGTNMQVQSRLGTTSSASPANAFWVAGGLNPATTVSPTPNKNKLYGVYLPYSITTSNVTIRFTTVDNTSNLYNFGIYDNNGNLVVQIGATAGSAFPTPSTANDKTFAWTSANTALAPGRYYLAITTNCSTSCIVISGTAATPSFLAADASLGTTLAVLPGTITPPADVWATPGTLPTFVVRP